MPSRNIPLLVRSCCNHKSYDRLLGDKKEGQKSLNNDSNNCFYSGHNIVLILYSIGSKFNEMAAQYLSGWFEHSSVGLLP